MTARGPSASPPRVALFLDESGTSGGESTTLVGAVAFHDVAAAELAIKNAYDRVLGDSSLWSDAAKRQRLARDGFVIAGLLDADRRGVALGTDVESRITEAVDGLLTSEYRGSWLDIPMARDGKKRAFVSNTLHNLRGMLAACAWLRRSLPAKSPWDRIAGAGPT